MTVAPGNNKPQGATVKRTPQREKILGESARAQVEALLLDGEKILRIAEIHPAIYWKGGALLAFALVLLILAFNLGLFMLFVAGVTLAYAYVTKQFLMLVVTNKRVLARYGIIKLEVVQIHHRKIESVELGWTILGQFLGYASIMITGTGSRVTVIPYVAQAPRFRKELEQILLHIAEGTKPDDPSIHD